MGKFVAWPGVLHACYRGSRAATSVTAVMLSIYHALHTHTRMVDLYIAPTDFVRNKFIQRGIPEEKIAVKQNFVDPDPGVGKGRDGYALFVGRLSKEKGISTLLSAWKIVGDKLPLKIVGDGSLASQVADAEQHISSVEYLGRKPIQRVLSLMKGAVVLIFPSIWYETFGLTISEAYSVGLPVIASNLGSMSSMIEHGRTGLHFRSSDSGDLAAQVDWIISHPVELERMRQEARAEYVIEDGRTGLHFKAGDAEALEARVDWALSHPTELKAMGREARAEYENKYTAELNYKMLMDIYKTAIERARGKSRI